MLWFSIRFCFFSYVRNITIWLQVLWILGWASFCIWVSTQSFFWNVVEEAELWTHVGWLTMSIESGFEWAMIHFWILISVWNCCKVRWCTLDTLHPKMSCQNNISFTESRILSIQLFGLSRITSWHFHWFHFYKSWWINCFI